MLKHLAGAWQLEPLRAHGGSCVTGTRLRYCHDVKPKGLPPGVRYVPGMSGAVRATLAKELQQMCDKVSYVADKVGRRRRVRRSRAPPLLARGEPRGAAGAAGVAPASGPVSSSWPSGGTHPPRAAPPRGRQVCRGLPVAAALEQTVAELHAAGGSFKKLRQRQAQLAEEQAGEVRMSALKSVPLTLDLCLGDNL
jgi:hypothetical protein